MKEYKVEYTAIKKEYWCYVVEAESQSDAIAKAKQAGLDVATTDNHEVASQCSWTASGSQGIFGWFKSLM